MKKLILIAGPSGAGKTTVSRYLTDKYQIPRVLTHTTRKPRLGEKNGVDYYFEDEASFSKLHFFESVNYSGHQYGSSKEALDLAWQKHEVVSLIVDVTGVESYVEKLAEQVLFIYVTVTDLSIIEERMRARGDSQESIAARTASAEHQRDQVLPGKLQQKAFILYNDDWDSTKERLDILVKSL